MYQEQQASIQGYAPVLMRDGLTRFIHFAGGRTGNYMESECCPTERRAVAIARLYAQACEVAVGLPINGLCELVG